MAWRRRQRGGETRGSITFAWSANDSELVAARDALAGGDWGPVRDLLAVGDAPSRYTVLEAVLAGPPPRVVLDEWVEHESSSGSPWLVRGAHAVRWAWEARGDGPATSVAEDAWATFHGRLRGAEEDLHRATRLAPDDALPWGSLITSGKGLEISKSEIRTRFDAAEARAPGIPGVADAMLQAICAKWFGSHDEMFEFARTSSRLAPVGDPRHRLVAEAHWEYLVAVADDASLRAAHVGNPAVFAEVVSAAQRSALQPGYGRTFEEHRTMNEFAFVFCDLGYPAWAAPLFEVIGDRPTGLPWSRSADPEELFLQFREAARATVRR